jgi:hypothetical protein
MTICKSRIGFFSNVFEANEWLFRNGSRGLQSVLVGGRFQLKTIAPQWFRVQRLTQV